MRNISNKGCNTLVYNITKNLTALPLVAGRADARLLIWRYIAGAALFENWFSGSYASKRFRMRNQPSG